MLPDYDWSFQFSVFCYKIDWNIMKAMDAEHIYKNNNEHFAMNVWKL